MSRPAARDRAACHIRAPGFVNQRQMSDLPAHDGRGDAMRNRSWVLTMVALIAIVELAYWVAVYLPILDRPG